MKFRHILAPCLALMTATTALAAEVNVYSYRQPELTAPLFDAFTEKTGIAVNVVFLKKGMVERLKSEGKRSPADLAFTSDIGRLAELKAAGVTQAVAAGPLSATIPAEFRDPEGHWFGLTARARVIYAARDRVGADEVTTYEDLADPKWKGRICTRSGTHSYNLALTAAMIANHDAAYAETWLAGVKANLARRPQGNDRAQVKAIWAGECDISIGNTYYMGAMLSNPEQKPWADAVRIEFPRFEGGGTHLNLSGVAMTGAAPNRDEALQLMAFLASETGQRLYAEAVFEYPVAPDVAPADLVAGWGTFTRDGAPLSEIARLRPDALKAVERVDFDQ